MQPVDNSQFTEEQRTEAFRQTVVQHLAHQSKTLEAIKTAVVLFMLITVIGGLCAALVVGLS